MVYINGTASLSPQNSLNYNSFLEGIVEYKDEFLQTIKPKYKDFLKPIEARRMSKTVKNGIICSQLALEQAKVEMPDAIIVGTGIGVITDTDKFLESMIENNEKFLTPTSFIQSTHNTVAGQIALKIKCHNYNFTYVNRAFSFESALLDGMMHLNEGKNNILIGGAEEMTEHYFRIIKKNGRWKTTSEKNTEILKTKSKGALCGESVNFFVLSSNKNENSYAKLTALKTFYKPKDSAEINLNLQLFLEENNTNLNNIDLIITGYNGDNEKDIIYDNFVKDNFSDKAIAYFKHLVGECQIASSFALWLVSNIIKTQQIPDFIMLNNKKVNEIKTVLIYNHYFNINHSFMLLSKV